ncbi:MAG: hypothetical protein CVV52_02375 [Spirochaetae bacterium HGW-Spirochaetae-8]|nr:MAG: hypothetical protein CVV52_02375 [Spirochaetae bacterium HGW-Spirochaetae-8]
MDTFNHTPPIGQGTSGFRVLIVRLSPFEDVARSSPHLFLYGECHRVLPDEQIDFAWLPTSAQRKYRKEQGLSMLYGIRSGIPASEFDLLLISNSYAMELLNLPFLLRESGLPLFTQERAAGRTGPLVVMGGSNALAAQAVLAPDGDAFVDALFFGEGEHAVTRLVQEIAQTTPEKHRQSLRALMPSIEGLLVFDGFNQTDGAIKQVRKSIYRAYNTDAGLMCTDYPLFDSEESSTARMQIAAGCPSFCTFCFEGWERKPYREVPYETLMESARKLKRDTGAETLEVIGFNFNTHQNIVQLMAGLNKIFARVNLMSQRIDILADHPTLVRYEVAGGKRSFTLGVEGISTRMRAYYHKELSETKIMQVLALLLKERIREIKFFYILSGEETEGDFAAFLRFLKALELLRKQTNTGVRLLFSFGLLVRMPFTPMRFAALLLGPSRWKAVIDSARRAVEMAGYEFRLAQDFPEYCFSQVLVMTPYPIARILAEISAKGFVYDQKLDSGAWEALRQSMERAGYLPASFVGEKEPGYPFAFGFLESPESLGFQYQRYLDAKAAVETPSCMGDVGRTGICSVCGACVLPEERKFLTQHSIESPSLPETTSLESLINAKATARPLFIRFSIPKELSNTGPEYRSAFVMRTLFQLVPGCESMVLSARDALLGSSVWKDRLIPWYGETVYALSLLPGTRETFVAALAEAQASIVAGIAMVSPDFINSLAGIEIIVQPQAPVSLIRLEQAVSTLLAARSLQATLNRVGEVTKYVLSPKSKAKRELELVEVRPAEADKSIAFLHLLASMKADISSLRTAKGGQSPLEAIASITLRTIR